MAYRIFGLQPDDVVTDEEGNVQEGATLTVWTAYTGGTQITDLYSLGGVLLGAELTTDARGRFPFKIPDNYTYRKLYVDDGQNPRWLILAQDVGDDIDTALATASAAYSVAQNAQSDASDALDTAEDAYDLAELANINATNALDQINNVQAGAIPSTYFVTVYGAIGDGSTDDYNALQAALDAAALAGGGKVVLPTGGTYVCNSYLRIYANTQLIIEPGAVLTTTSGMTVLINYNPAGVASGYTGEGNIYVGGGGVIDMRGHANTEADSHNCMTFAHAHGITVENLTIRNVKGYHAIELHSVRAARVHQVRFEGHNPNNENTPREAVQIDMVGLTGDDDTPTQDAVISECWCGASPVAGECGPWAKFVGGHTVGTVPYQRIKVLNNEIDGTVGVAILPFAWQNSIVANNTIIDAGAEAIQARAGNGVVSRSLTIADNTIINSTGTGIQVISSPDGNTKPVGFSVTGNVMRNTGSNGIYINADIGVVANNFVHTTSANYGIQIGGGSSATAEEVLVTGNRIEDPATAGIRINYAQNCYITTNMVTGNSTGFSAGGTTANNTGTRVRQLFVGTNLSTDPVYNGSGS